MTDQTVGLGNGSTTAVTPKTRKERGTVTADKDLTACAKISKIVNDLNDGDRKTVVEWFARKYVA